MTVTIVTTLCGLALPLLVFVIKLYWDKKSLAAATQARQDAETKAAGQDVTDATHQSGGTATDIDAQRKAREDWAKNHP